MFAHWRGKRHYPAADAEALVAALNDSNEAGRGSPRPANGKSALRINATMKGFGKGIARNRTPRDGSISSQSDYDFAAGPRSGSRGAKSLEFGSGVVPDRPSESDTGFTSESRSSAASGDTGHPTAIIGYTASPSLQHLDIGNRSTVTSHSPVTAQAPTIEEGELELDGFDDFRAILALATSPLSEELSGSGGGWTDGSNQTTPESISMWSPASKGFDGRAKHSLGTPASSVATHSARGHSKKLSLAEAMAIFGQTSPSSLHHEGEAGPSVPPKDPRVRTASTTSYPETVSGPSSTDTDSKEFSKPHTGSSSSQLLYLMSSGSSAPKALQAVRPVEVQERHGLGIFGGEEPHYDVSDGSNRSSRVKTSSISSGFTDRSHRKSESYHSTQSSTDSWARSSRLIEIERQSSDGPDGDGFGGRRGAARMVVSDSDHSVGTAETSYDLHELGSLTTITEKTEDSPPPDSNGSARVRRPREAGHSASIDAMGHRDRQISLESSLKSPFSSTTDTATSTMSPRSPGTSLRSSPVIRRKMSHGVLGIATPTFGCAPDQISKSRGHKASYSAGEVTVSTSTDDSSTPTAPAFGSTTPKSSVDFNPHEHRRRPSGTPKHDRKPSSSKTQTLYVSSLTAPMPSVPFPGAMLSTPDASSGSGFASLPTSPLADGGQVKQGLRRKARPAALTLSKSTSNLQAPFAASAPSPSGILRGAPSPTRSRAPPPTAPPPDEPLPPLPPTPSLIAPKSPLIMSRKSSASNLARAAADAPPTPTLPRIAAPRTPRSTSFPPQTPVLGSVQPEKSYASPAAAASVPAHSQPKETRVETHDATVAKRAIYGDQILQPGRPEALSLQVCGVGYSSSTEELNDSSAFQSSTSSEDTHQTFRRHAFVPTPTGAVAKSPPESDRTSVLSTESQDEGHGEEDARLEVATTLTRIPSSAVRMTSLRIGPRAKFVSSSNSPATPMADNATPAFDSTDLEPTQGSSMPTAAATTMPKSSGAPLTTVQRLTAQIESRSGQQSSSSPASKAPSPLPPATTSRPQHTAPPSSWTKRFERPSTTMTTGSLGSSGDPHDTGRAATEGGHEKLADGGLGKSSAVDRRASYGSLRTRRLEMVKDKADLALASDDKSKASILKRTEGRFTDAFGEVAQAFKQLLAEKRMLEQLIRDVTPLDGIGENGQGLVDYIVGLNERMESSTAEIRKLLDLLEQQRLVMEKMLDTHRIEVDAYLDEIDGLHRHLDDARHEASVHRANAMRFHEDLDRAHQEIVAAKAEALKARNGLFEEVSKREKAGPQVRILREKLQTAEASIAQRDQAIAALEEARANEKETLLAEVAMLRETLAKDESERGAALVRSQTRRTNSPDVGKHGEINDDRLDDRNSSPWSPCSVSGYDSAKLGQSSLRSPFDSDPPQHGSEDIVEQLRRENAELKRSLIGKEAELVQARIGSADGAVLEWSDDASSSKPASESASDASSVTELKRLRAQLTEQRHRESQIRTAYKILREELRKTQTGFQSERRRNSGYSWSSHGHGVLSASMSASAATFSLSHGGGGDDESSSHAEPVSPRDDRRGSTSTSIKLKRLSLPLNSEPPHPRSAHTDIGPASASSYVSNATPPSTGRYRPSSAYGSTSGLMGKRPMSTYRVGIPVFPSSPMEPSETP